MKHLSSFARLVQASCLDVALIATSLYYTLCLLWNIEPEWIYTLGLFLAVWSIYLADHIVDIFKSSGRLASERRLFYERYKGVFITLLVLILLVEFTLFLNIDLAIQKRLAFMISGVLAYLVFASTFSYPLKEVSGALLYSLGIFFVPFLHSPDWMMLLFWAEVFIAAWVNMLVLAVLDHETDVQEGFTSYSTLLGKEKAERTIKILLGFYFVLFAGGFLLMNETTNMIFHVSMLLTVVTQWIVFNQPLSWKTRLLSDLGFLWPAVLVNGSYYLIQLNLFS